MVLETYISPYFLQFDEVNVASMLSALVPSQLGEKAVSYPIRPVDTTTDFEGSTSVQGSQSVRN